MNDKDMIKWLKEALDLKDKLLDAFREENEQLKQRLENYPKPVFIICYCSYYADIGYSIRADWLYNGRLLLWRDDIFTTRQGGVYDTKAEAEAKLKELKQPTDKQINNKEDCINCGNVDCPLDCKAKETEQDRKAFDEQMKAHYNNEI